MEEHEEQEHEGWSIVYFCASAQNEILELYHKKSPPSITSETFDLPSSVNQIYTNVRALLDEDQGGFDEVFVSSSSGKCLDRLEKYAHTVPIVVLVELSPALKEAHDTPNTSKDKKNPWSFLRDLSADIQGARFQRHVLPFALVAADEQPDIGSALDGATFSDTLHAGAIDVVQNPLRHEDLNHLIGHIKEKMPAPAALIATQMAQNLVDSIHNFTEPREPNYRPDLLLSSQRKAAVESAITQWHFPAQSFNMDELTYGVMFMVEQVLTVPELHAYALPRSKLISLLLETRRQYKHEREVHYHNWRHAVDVAQSIFCFLLDMQLCKPHAPDNRNHKDLTPVERLLTPLDALILLVSAIGHDVGHPGVNNAFLVACNHPLAQTYNDKSVLENYHCAAYSQLLRRHWPALNNIAGFRSTMIATILATDMQRHFEYMKSLGDLRAKTESSEPGLDDWADKDKEQARELIMGILIKAADISNVARPFDISAAWAKILMNEFARQGELESELEIPTCLFGGPPNKEDILAAAQSQKGFINLFGHPLFKGISDLMPTLSGAVRELENNRKRWEEKINKETERRKLVKEESQASFSGVTDEEVAEAISHHNSDPAIAPSQAAQARSGSLKRATIPAAETSPSRRAVHDLRQHLTQNFGMNDPSQMNSGTGLSPSRRSSKDVALDSMQSYTTSSYQGPDLTPPAGSRRESTDAGMEIRQSYPGSRRGSKDESLTTILVTSGGSPRKSSPSLPGKVTSPGKTGGKRQSLPYSQRQAASRTSAPISKSNTTSSATTSTTQQSTSPPSSAQLSSVVLGEGLGSRGSLPATEDPFMTPRNWPNDSDGVHRESGPDELPSSPPTPPPLNSMEDKSPPITHTLSTETNDSRSTPRKGERGVRESRSRSRLRGLKFWKKKKDSTSAEVPADSLTGTP